MNVLSDSKASPRIDHGCDLRDRPSTAMMELCTKGLLTSPCFIQRRLTDLPRPLVTGLMHDWRHLFFVDSLIRDCFDSSLQVLLQEHPTPAPSLANTTLPSSNLSIVIIATTTLPKSCIPLEPAAYIVRMRYPARDFPLFNALSTSDLEFIDLWIVGGACKVSFNVQVFQPFSRQFFPVILYCSA